MIDDCVPGQLIEWCSNVDNVKTRVRDYEKLWSSYLYVWVPVGGCSILVSKTPECFSFLRRGFLYAVDADNCHPLSTHVHKIYPFQVD